MQRYRLQENELFEDVETSNFKGTHYASISDQASSNARVAVAESVGNVEELKAKAQHIFHIGLG